MASSTYDQGVVVHRLGMDTVFLRASGVVEYQVIQTPREQMSLSSPEESPTLKAFGEVLSA